MKRKKVKEKTRFYYHNFRKIGRERERERYREREKNKRERV